MKVPAARALGWVLVFLGVLALTVTVVASAVIAAKNTEIIRQVQKSNTAIAADNTETLNLVKSCTTPGRKCFNEGQKRTGEAVGSINKITVYAAVCADRPGTQNAAQIETCVRAKLAANAAR